MQYKKLSLLFHILIFSTFTYAQINTKNVNFLSPVDFPIYLSGNFGEIRSNHFHAGIDIKTQGVIGKKIYAVESGYISRIKVSANSYGKTIYIMHPNGYTTVYGHLSRFNNKIDKLVKKLQYQNSEFEINYFPKQDELIVKKGEIIGFSGNTGSSEGPHLHFEVRESENQIPINPLLFNFKVTDNIAPTLYTLSIYPLNINSKINGNNEPVHLKLKQNSTNFLPDDTSQILLSGLIGFGIEMNDFLNRSRNKCGIYSLSVSIDSVLIYKHTLDKFSFNETGYVKSHIDYSEKLQSKRTIQKTFIAPNNRMSIYDYNLNNGKYNFDKDTIYNVKIIATDVAGNISKLAFDILGQSVSPETILRNDSLANTFLDWKKENIFEQNEIRLRFPAKTFFDTLNFKYSSSKPIFKANSNMHHIHNTYTAINKKYSISIKTINLPKEIKDKALIAEVYNDEFFSIGGEFIDEYIVSESKTLGDFIVLVDTIMPEVKLKSDFNKLNNKIEFIITDDLSGIKSYNGYIDNNWALFEYDQKNDLLFYILDDKKIKKGIEHELELFVIDNKENISTFYTNFYW